MATLKTQPLDTWGIGQAPFYIFGPCSAESEAQLRSTALALKQGGLPFVLRAGVWKPRTRPGTFEGRGLEALAWMRDISEELDIPTATEVANAEHVEACLKYGVDVLWIGARTTVNPFSVQEIADALKGVDIPVFVKNPIHPDLALWIGALERIAGAGIERLGAIHRGFHHHDNKPYRNQPDWEIPIELRRRFRELPLICDASHISGKPSLIPHVAQRALDLQMDGLLIETHINPTEALSDAKQQITPAQLFELMSDLEFKAGSFSDPDLADELGVLRARIDAIDESIGNQLAERMRVVEEIAKHKKAHNVALLQVQRWADILQNYLESGAEHGLDAEFMQRIVEAIHIESIEAQQRIIDQAGNSKA